MLGGKQITNAAPVRQADGAQGLGKDAPGRPSADILDEMERVLREQQELVLRLEALADDSSDGATRERAAIGHHMACHANDIERLIGELSAIEPPDELPLV